MDANTSTIFWSTYVLVFTLGAGVGVVYTYLHFKRKLNKLLKDIEKLVDLEKDLG